MIVSLEDTLNKAAMLADTVEGKCRLMERELQATAKMLSCYGMMEREDTVRLRRVKADTADTWRIS